MKQYVGGAERMFSLAAPGPGRYKPPTSAVFLHDKED
jgi:hypothetical protein